MIFLAVCAVFRLLNLQGIIEHSPDIPSELKSGLIEDVEVLQRDQVLPISGEDVLIRPYFVSFQGLVESRLTQLFFEGKVSELQGIILTPYPPTPLCMNRDVSQDLVNCDIAQDPLRLYTIRSRAAILREYLNQGARLDCYYLKCREGVSQTYFEEALAHYPTLSAHLLPFSEIPSDLIGAIYTFKIEDKNYGFAIQMPQANTEQIEGHFCLWLGEIEHPALSERLRAVRQFIATGSK
jgi:hypothetical protein